ncbi:hypothetical protein PVK06_042829 [Gossypium arboreum]|uniref:Uncharacterized protein n=1 Tax=Gossypium arboreum TaxID=29729 RepID=A0ABR0MNM3_GOSAR|nr:hypothetical protein PVK06_042829 [Gossypium arboreum]
MLTSGGSFKCNDEKGGLEKGRRNLEMSRMARERALFRFLKPGQCVQLADIQATAMWGVAATGALSLI